MCALGLSACGSRSHASMFAMVLVSHPAASVCLPPMWVRLGPIIA